eukprot:1099123-Pyramimonas_sp.AAC.2
MMLRVCRHDVSRAQGEGSGRKWGTGHRVRIREVKLGVLSAPLPLLAQEDPYNEVMVSPRLRARTDRRAFGSGDMLRSALRPRGDTRGGHVCEQRPHLWVGCWVGIVRRRRKRKPARRGPDCCSPGDAPPFCALCHKSKSSATKPDRRIRPARVISDLRTRLRLVP